MTVATISKPGLSLIAILVAVLWAFVVTNRLIVRRAQLEASHTIEDTKSRHGVRRSKKPSLRQALVKRIGTVYRPFRWQTEYFGEQTRRIRGPRFVEILSRST